MPAHCFDGLAYGLLNPPSQKLPSDLPIVLGVGANELLQSGLVGLLYEEKLVVLGVHLVEPDDGHIQMEALDVLVDVQLVVDPAETAGRKLLDAEQQLGCLLDRQEHAVVCPDDLSASQLLKLLLDVVLDDVGLVDDVPEGEVSRSGGEGLGLESLLVERMKHVLAIPFLHLLERRVGLENVGGVFLVL